MNHSPEVDYHIEISSIVEFVNEQIGLSPLIPISGEEIYKHIKKAILDSEIKPFLSYPPKEEDKEYYNNYCKRVKDINEKYIPDFFESEGDFYDLDRRLNIVLENTNKTTFCILFSLKILELKSKNMSVDAFLNFQLYDNFFGDKMLFDSFLHEMLAKDSKSHLFPSINDEIKTWISKDDLSIIHLPVENKPIPPKVNEIEDEKKYQELLNSKRGYKIPGRFTDEQIRNFFSFLYLEKSADKNPFLKEEEVNIIFANGLTIPSVSPSEKFSLNRSLKYPKKIVEKGIHLFFTMHSITTRDKSDFILFFANYIKDFEKVLYSQQSLTNAANNMNGKTSPKNRIVWDNYLPK